METKMQEFINYLNSLSKEELNKYLDKNYNENKEKLDEILNREKCEFDGFYIIGSEELD